MLFLNKFKYCTLIGLIRNPCEISTHGAHINSRYVFKLYSCILLMYLIFCIPEKLNHCPNVYYIQYYIF